MTKRPFLSLTPDARNAVVATTVVRRSSPMRTTGAGEGGVGSVAKGLFKRRFKRKAISLACLTLAEPLPWRSRGRPTTMSTMPYSAMKDSSLSMSPLSGSFNPVSEAQSQLVWQDVHRDQRPPRQCAPCQHLNRADAQGPGRLFRECLGKPLPCLITPGPKEFLQNRGQQQSPARCHQHCCQHPAPYLAS